MAVCPHPEPFLIRSRDWVASIGTFEHVTECSICDDVVDVQMEDGGDLEAAAEEATYR